MTTEIALTLTIIVAALALFATEKLRVDLRTSGSAVRCTSPPVKSWRSLWLLLSCLAGLLVRQVSVSGNHTYNQLTGYTLHDMMSRKRDLCTYGTVDAVADGSRIAGAA